MSATAEQKFDELQEIIKGYRRVTIALSGGLDSSFLLYASVQALSKENVFAAIGVSDSLAESELMFAREFAQGLGLDESHIMQIKTNEIENPDYAANPPNRCYFCKSELYQKLEAMALERGEIICDGSNASDVGDYRPGMIAAAEKKVQSPLLKAGLTKDEIRQLARKFDLTIWDKPQSACLSSRIPYGSSVTSEKLKQIESAEAFLKSLGFRQLRVRHHDTIARIEVPESEMTRIVANGLRAKIAERFRQIGFLYTTLDIMGFRSGSLNEGLKKEENA